MIYNKGKNLQQQLIELRELEQAAQVRFTEAKNNLINIRRKILELKKLIDPPVN